LGKIRQTARCSYVDLKKSRNLEQRTVNINQGSKNPSCGFTLFFFEWRRTSRRVLSPCIPLGFSSLFRFSQKTPKVMKKSDPRGTLGTILRPAPILLLGKFWAADRLDGGRFVPSVEVRKRLMLSFSSRGCRGGFLSTSATSFF